MTLRAILLKFTLVLGTLLIVSAICFHLFPAYSQQLTNGVGVEPKEIRNLIKQSSDEIEINDPEFIERCMGVIDSSNKIENREFFNIVVTHSELFDRIFRADYVDKNLPTGRFAHRIVCIDSESGKLRIINALAVVRID